MSKIKVAHIIARLNIGGPAVHIAHLLAGLSPARFESCLIAGRPGPDEGDMAYLFEQKGLVPPIVLSALGRNLSPVRDLRTILQLVSILRCQHPHIVETHTAKAGFVGRLAARLAGVPVVLHVFHGHVFYGYFGALQTRAFIGIERLLARWTDRVIVLSPAQQRDIVHTYHIAPPGKVAVIPLGFDLQPFVTARSMSGGAGRIMLGIPEGVPLVGYVGRLTPVKNPMLFCSVARRVLDFVPDAHFVLVGDGELRSDVERQIALLGLSERVRLAGWQRDMPPLYAALDTLVLPSLNEGTSVTAIEALACGVPVVATSVGGMPDLIVDGESGLLAPSGDVEALAGHVIRLLREPAFAHGLAAAGQTAVQARFGVERLVQDMEALYTALLEEKGIQV